MDTGSFSYFSSGEFTNHSSLLKAALDHLPVHMLIAKSVWQDDQITDFILVFANKLPENHTPRSVCNREKFTHQEQAINNHYDPNN